MVARPRAYVVAALLFTIPAVLSAIESSVYVAQMGQVRPFWYMFMAEGSPWYAWALLAPAIVTLAMRLPLTWPPRARNLAVHLGVLIAAAATHGVVCALALERYPIMPQHSTTSFPVHVAHVMISWAPLSVILYAVLVGAGTALSFAREVRARERTEAALGEALARAELSALRSQLQPHFVFNTLHSVSMLMREGDNARAQRVVQLFADVLRNVLHADATLEVPLASEIDTTARYLAIEETRFEDRLRVEWRVDPALRDALVPSLVLQPLVENAIRHGIAPRAAPGVVEVGARRDGDMLELWVRDDGVGLDAPAPAHPIEQHAGNGIGLRNTRARLAGLYGEAASLALDAGDGRGAIARVRLPYREGSVAASEPVDAVSDVVGDVVNVTAPAGAAPSASASA
jgi:hypothetical protein